MSQRTWKSWEEDCLEREAKLAVTVEVRTYQDSLKRVLKRRFPTVPEPLLASIDLITDPERLKAALDQVVEITKPEELHL